MRDQHFYTRSLIDPTSTTYDPIPRQSDVNKQRGDDRCTRDELIGARSETSHRSGRPRPAHPRAERRQSHHTSSRGAPGTAPHSGSTTRHVPTGTGACGRVRRGERHDGLKRFGRRSREKRRAGTGEKKRAHESEFSQTCPRAESRSMHHRLLRGARRRPDGRADRKTEGVTQLFSSGNYPLRINDILDRSKVEAGRCAAWSR